MQVLIAVLAALPTLTLTVTVLIRLARRARRGADEAMPLRLQAFVLVASLTPLGAPVAWTISSWYGVAYALASYAFAVVFAIELEATRMLPDWVVIASLLVTGAALFTIIPMAFLPRLTVSLFTAKARPVPPPPLDVAFIRKSVDSIKRSLNASVDDIQREQSRIEAASQVLQAQVERQNVTIINLTRQRDSLVREVERERVLAALTTDQAESIRKSLNRGKYFDYIIGFILGILSSVVASLSVRLVESRRAGQPTR